MTAQPDVVASVIPEHDERTEVSQYLSHGEHRIFSVHHPALAAPRDVAVLFCAPFGWEEVCSHRILREWSLRLARAGYASLRWSLPGSGDSTGSPSDGDLSTTWLAATQAAASWLRDASGARSVVAIGLGLGGMLAYRAAAAGAPIDGFVLWGAACRGRDVIRQLRAFSKLESSEFFLGIEPPPPLEEGALEAGGFLLSPATVEGLRRLDLSDPPAPEAKLGVLLLERDGVSPDARLLDALSAAAVEVTTGPGSGYAEMTSHPQRSAMPEAVLTDVARWLEAHSSLMATAPSRRTLAPAESEATFSDGFTERPFEMRTADGALRGILTDPGSGSSRLCAVFLNAGAQRRIGPNRMWVEAARRWASLGVSSLRLDMLGIGEADGLPTPYARDMTLYDPRFPPRVTAVVDELERQGVADRFILIGLCAGAYWALHAGLDDDRVVGIMMLNPVAVIWDDDIGAGRDLRRVFTDRSWRLIRKNATPQRLRAVARMAAGLPSRLLVRLRARTGGPPSLDMQIRANLARWENPATRITAMFAQREGLILELERFGALSRLEALPHIAIRRLPINDHTLRPVAIQRLVHDELDEQLRHILADGEQPASHGSPIEGARR